MSYENYEKAIAFAKTLPKYKVYDCCSDKAMDELEDFLGFELSKQHYEFLKQGALDVWIYEFFANYSEEHDYWRDITANLNSQKRNGLIVDDKFVPVISDDEWVNYLNYNRLNKDGEPTIVYAWPTPDEFIIFEQTDQDLGDFLLELFEEISDGLEEI